MVNYNQFAISDDIACNIYNALLYCHKNNEDTLVFDKNTYHIFSQNAPDYVCCLSNHSSCGFNRCLFLIKEFENFTIDGGGSEFIFHDLITPVIIADGKNISIKNCSFKSLRNLTAQFDVVASNEYSADLYPTFGKTFIHCGELYEGDYSKDNYKLRFMIVYDENGKITQGKAGDYYIAPDDDAERIVFKSTQNGTIKAENLPVKVYPGQRILFNSGSRVAANIFIDNSFNTNIENINMHSGVGMGVIAQNCDTVSIEGLVIRPDGERCHSINVDATHFVHCKGKINIKNSVFDSQLDDALNIHSMYLKIIAKNKNSILVKQVNTDQKGIDIVRGGDIIQTCDPYTLLPNGEYKVLSAKRINLEVTEITLDENTENIRIGDVADEISWVPDITFENCKINNVRGRGMLLASSGKIIIRNNYFKGTTGAAIKFESDGIFWYESGRTKDVLICNNVFDNCKYCDAGNSVIMVMPREKTEKDKFYHGKIEVRDNEFKNCKGILAYINNTESFVFENNLTNGHSDGICDVFQCKKVRTDIDI